MDLMTNWVTALPEIMVLSLACIVLMAAAWLQNNSGAACYRMSQLGLMFTLFVLVNQPIEQTQLLFNSMYVSDVLSHVLKVGMLILTLIAMIYARAYLDEHRLITGEFFVLALFALLGMMVMASANNMLTIYLGLELLSLSLYAMVAMHRDSVFASEAAMKYFVLGAIASGMLLYGMSMIYGYSGSLDLNTIATHFSSMESIPPIYAFGIVFILAGVGFKLGVVPFHMWVPDVYQGSPTAVTLFIGSVSKLAGFALAIRLLVDGLDALAIQWQSVLVVLAILSIALGNVIAIAQTNIKRMLAYSTIAHMGYMLLGILSASSAGYASAMFYTLVYAIMSVGAFGMIILMSRYGHEADLLDDYRGLSKNSPWFALIMLVLMFSMAGVPPFAGFWAKWFVLKEVIAAGYVWLAASAVFFSIIGAYYYLRIIKLMYFDDVVDQHPTALENTSLRLVLGINAGLVLWIGLMPNGLMTMCLASMVGH